MDYIEPPKTRQETKKNKKIKGKSKYSTKHVRLVETLLKK
jgi:hypothetical protein